MRSACGVLSFCTRKVESIRLSLLCRIAQKTCWVNAPKCAPSFRAAFFSRNCRRVPHTRNAYGSGLRMLKSGFQALNSMPPKRVIDDPVWCQDDSNLGPSKRVSFCEGGRASTPRWSQNSSANTREWTATRTQAAASPPEASTSDSEMRLCSERMVRLDKTILVLAV